MTANMAFQHPVLSVNERHKAVAECFACGLCQSNRNQEELHRGARLRRPFIICVDATVHFAADRWKQLLKEYCECEIVDDVSDALSLLSRCHVDALVVTSGASTAKILMHISELTSDTPVVLLTTEQGITKDGLVEEIFQFPIECVSDMPSLLAFLRRCLASPTKYRIMPSIYRMAPLRWPFGVLVDRRGDVIRFEGETVTIGSGGMFGELVEPLILGEYVLIDFPKFPDAAQCRASVRSRYGDVYGFFFEQKKTQRRFSLDLECIPAIVGAE